MTSVQGWTLFGHPLFVHQLERLTAAVEQAKARSPETYQGSANAKLLAQLNRLVFETVPMDPSRPEFRQGGTLGAERKHWFRAKFGGGRFRLFFRYSSSAKVIIYAWVNDSETLRTYGAKTDAYAVFKAMLDMGNPPESWTGLLAASTVLESKF
jgi:toxin YhaV